MVPLQQGLSSMSKKKWFILATLGLGLGLMGMALLLVLVFGFFAFAGHEETTGAGSLLPIYTMDQTVSSHAGYRRSTVASGSDVFVSDYEESALQLTNPEPSTVIGHLGSMGVIKVCSIPGQPVTAYIACDCGSEMPDYLPFRSINQKPFDWRTTTFREMKAYGSNKSSPYLTTTDEALMAEVVRTLRDGTPVELPSFPFSSIPSLPCLKMSSDELPGLLFCPLVFTDANGQIYLAESLMYDDAFAPKQLHARWVPASPTLAQWLKGP
jgi:hypothetical protein